MPAWSARWRVSGNSMLRLTSAASFCTTAGGVPLAAYSATHDSSKKPGKPASAMVGTWGNWGWRILPVTAKPLSLPANTWPITEGGVVMNTCTWPVSTS